MGATSRQSRAVFLKGRSTPEQYPHRSYVMQWNFNVQRELVRNLTLMMGYVGSRGVHEPFRMDDANIVLPTATPAGYLFPQVDLNGNQCLGSTATISCPANLLDSGGNPIPPPRNTQTGVGSVGFLPF